ncbi:MAG TPA: lactate utilization protein [Treponemataceae bacterium]|nr:lactate utilization protein [Treponemataceae bacterium]
MNNPKIWHRRTIAEKTCEALKKNGFKAKFVATAQEAADIIIAGVSADMTVGFGGSMTIKSLNIADPIKQKDAHLLEHGAKDLSKEEKLNIMRAQLSCDFFISSSNAITLDGEIFNIDGTGNRVAALTFGPKKTTVVVGYNKIVKNLADAETRLKMIASPMNTKRLNKKTPCATTGICSDCDSTDRICRIYTTLKRCPSQSDFTVIIVGEELGY